jgi:hypothetical protein
VKVLPVVLGDHRSAAQVVGGEQVRRTVADVSWVVRSGRVFVALLVSEDGSPQQSFRSRCGSAPLVGSGTVLGAAGDRAAGSSSWLTAGQVPGARCPTTYGPW